MTNLLKLLAIAFAILISSCADDPDPCEYKICINGYCSNGECICPPGWSGTSCQIEGENNIEGGGVDPCNQIDCFNGGECINNACNCLEAWTGVDCSDQKMPAIVKITQIEISNFSNSDSNGDALDGNGTYPDIYVSISPANSTTNTGVTNTINNANPTGIYSVNNTINITAPLSTYYIELWDNDSGDAFAGGDDLMCSYSTQFYWDNSGFPASFPIQVGNGCLFTVFVEYDF